MRVEIDHFLKWIDPEEVRLSGCPEQWTETEKRCSADTYCRCVGRYRPT